MHKKDPRNEFEKAKNILETNSSLLLKYQKGEVDKNTLINILIKQNDTIASLMVNIEQRLTGKFALYENDLTQKWWEDRS